MTSRNKVSPKKTEKGKKKGEDKFDCEFWLHF